MAEVEIPALRSVAVNLRLDANVVEQMLHLGGQSLDDAYAVLGLTKDATDDEIYQNSQLHLIEEETHTMRKKLDETTGIINNFIKNK